MSHIPTEWVLADASGCRRKEVNASASGFRDNQRRILWMVMKQARPSSEPHFTSKTSHPESPRPDRSPLISESRRPSRSQTAHRTLELASSAAAGRRPRLTIRVLGGPEGHVETSSRTSRGTLVLLVLLLTAGLAVQIDAQAVGSWPVSIADAMLDLDPFGLLIHEARNDPNIQPATSSEEL